MFWERHAGASEVLGLASEAPPHTHTQPQIWPLRSVSITRSPAGTGDDVCTSGSMHFMGTKSYLHHQEKKTFLHGQMHFYCNACSMDMGKKECRPRGMLTKAPAVPRGLEMTPPFTAKHLRA